MYSFLTVPFLSKTYIIICIINVNCMFMFDLCKTTKSYVFRVTRPPPPTSKTTPTIKFLKIFENIV